MGEILFNKLPWLYEDSQEVKALQDSFESELGTLDVNFQDLYKQVFLEDADWSIYRWEKMLGITPITDDIQIRKEYILAKLRSSKPSSKQTLQELCMSFSGGEVKIIEDNPNYSFIIKFISEQSIPSNLDVLTQLINDVKPSHLSWSYLLAYNIWLQSVNKTWVLSSETWADDKTADFIEIDMKAICSINTVCGNALTVGSGV